MKQPADIIRTLRDNLGVIRSCALMMAHAQSQDARTVYLQRLNEKLATMDELLAELSKANKDTKKEKESSGLS